MNNKPSPLSIMFIVLLLAALVGGVMLAGQNQNQQRGAYFAGAKLSMLPIDIAKNVGDEFTAQLWVNTENGAKINAVDTTICYGKGVKLDAADPSTLVELNPEAFKVIQYINDDKAAGCLRMLIASIGMADANVKSGLVRVANIKFKAITAGTGKLELKAADTVLGGINPSGTSDSGISLSGVDNANYVISEGGGPTITPTPTCVKRPDCLDATPRCNMPELETYCPPNTPTPTPTGGVVTNTPTPTPTLVTEVVAPYLKFRVSLLGMRFDSKCREGDKLPLVVTVRAADGAVKTLTGVIPIKETSTSNNGLASYSVKVHLTDFPYKNNLSVFVKSPKSLQVKYGKDKQTDYYGVAGGELSGLSESETNTPVFDFTGYPLLAGDVTGANGAQDGSVDGLDFSMVKSESNKRTEVADGGYMLADLNGNCKMESQDLSNLMISLSVKQGQLY